MRRKLQIFIIFTLSLLWLILLQVVVRAETYYVDANNSKANDTNPGTSDAPWKTFDRALPNDARSPTVSQGDTVYVAAGDYGYVFYAEGGDTRRNDFITYYGGTPSGYGTKPVIAHLQITNTANVYMKFYNFSIYEDANPNEFDRSLDIYGTDATTNRCNKIEFYDCYIQATTTQRGLRAVFIKYADDIVLEDCEIDGGLIGLLVSHSGTNITVTNCHFHDQWGDMVDLYGDEDGTSVDNVILDGCFFEDLIWLEDVTPEGFHLDYYQSSGNTNTGDAVNDVIIRNCTFKFTFNTDWDVPEGFTYVGIQPQAHGTNFTFENNLLYGICRAAGFKFSIKVAETVKDNVIVRNNTFGATSTEGYTNNLTSKLTGVQHHNNIYHTGFVITTPSEEVTQGNNIYNSYQNVGDKHTGPTISESSVEIGEAGVEALFVDFTNDDFRLAEDSLARDFGDPAHAPATDILGNPRDAFPDAGCYEYITLQRPDRSEDKTEVKCYNNVFNPIKGEEALIWVELPKQARVKVDLYNTRSNRIRELADEHRDAGPCRYYWNGRDDSENIVGSGLYFVHVEAGDYKKTKKIVVVK